MESVKPGIYTPSSGPPSWGPRSSAGKAFALSVTGLVPQRSPVKPLG